MHENWATAFQEVDPLIKATVVWGKVTGSPQAIGWHLGSLPVHRPLASQSRVALPVDGVVGSEKKIVKTKEEGSFLIRFITFFAFRAKRWQQPQWKFEIDLYLRTEYVCTLEFQIHKTYIQAGKQSLKRIKVQSRLSTRVFSTLICFQKIRNYLF